MKRSIEVCGTAAFCILAAACAQLPQPKDDPSMTRAPEPQPDVSVAGAEEQAESYDEGNRGSTLPGASLPEGGKRESLTCFTGSEDRHARIGVELVNQQVTYFAYYSKWRPRTCSLEAGRGDPYSRWTDNGAYHTVTLADRKGQLQIAHKDGAYRFEFLDVDRVRYCGMQGKINGSLTVVRGKSSCVVKGVMDGHAY